MINGEYDPPATELVLVGNSHAQMYTPIIKSRTEDTKGILVPLIGCLPTTDVNISQQCLNLARKNQTAISRLPALKRIVVGMTWYFGDFYSEDGRVGKQELVDDLLSSINLYEELGIEVFVISPLPIPNFNHASELSRKLKFGHISTTEYLDLSKISLSKFHADISVFDETLRDKLGAKYIKAYEKMCDDEFCYFGDLGGSYFSDENHLSSYGVSLLSPLFEVIDP